MTDAAVLIRRRSRPPRSAPETLELRARPQPVTRINRKVLIGGAAVLLFLISGIVLVALKPPEPAPRRATGALQCRPQAHHRRAVEAAGHLRWPARRRRRPTRPKLPPGVPQLTPASTRRPLDDAERVEKARLARMAGQARESRKCSSASSSRRRRASQSPPIPRPDPIPRPTPRVGGRRSDDAIGPARGRARPRLGSGRRRCPGQRRRADQTRKLSFLKSGPEKEIYNPHGLQKPVSPYQLMAGTIIAASLVSGLNSDLPGFVIAQVTENVYDTVSGRHLLIPQGSRLVGKYDNVVAFGQERALVVWQRIILPDGSSVVIDNLPATDTGGYAGLADQVDLHTWKLLKGVALATVLGVGSQLAFGSSDSDLVKALQQSTQSTTNRAGQRLVERNLNVQPTITVRPGWPLRVIVHKDLVLRPYRGRRRSET